MDELQIIEHGILRAVDARQWDDALALAGERDDLVRRLSSTLRPEQLIDLSTRNSELLSIVVSARDSERENLASFRKTMNAARAYAST
ncbi:MAG: hypothetical protein AAF578_02430 [Pseudomonadota bacterium]